MKKNGILWMFTMLMLAVGMGSCSSSDDESDLMKMLEKGEYGDLLIPLYSPNDINWYDRNRQWETIGKWDWQVLIDETGRYYGCFFWDAPNGVPESLEKLYAAPSSIDELNGLLYTIDDNYELRLDTVEHYTPDAAGNPRRGECYLEYYKGVPVFEGQYFCQFSTSPKGDRITHCSGQVITFDPLDVVPTLTPQQALKIFSAYQKEPVDPSWECYLGVREYNIKTERDDTYAKLLRREHRLVYFVHGPYYRYKDWDLGYKTIRIRAEIDAHTGQILVIGGYMVTWST